MLKGKKTFVVAGAAVLYAGIGFALGHLDANAAVQVIVDAGLVAGLRDAIKSKV